MKENCVKMQEISIGLQRLNPSGLACKENIHGGSFRTRKSTLAFGICGEGETCTVGELANFHQTLTPLPRLSWVNSGELWQRMRAKDVTRAAPEAELRMRHSSVLPSMRTILLDWMMEVRVWSGGWGHWGSCLLSVSWQGRSGTRDRERASTIYFSVKLQLM